MEARARSNKKTVTPKAGSARRALVVAGMHRSGTSAFARLLNLLGADLGKTLMAPGDFRGNPRGFWESVPILGLHDELLRAAGRTWHDFSPILPSWFDSKAAREYEGRLATVLTEEYGKSPFFVVKDPRICLLVPLWLATLRGIGVEPSFVIPVRQPLEVAGSLKARNRFGPTKSLLLWLRHVLDVERNTRGERRSFVAYEALLSDWRSVASRLSDELAIDWPKLSKAGGAEIDGFLSRDERHHLFTAEELEANHEVSVWVKRTYQSVARLASGSQDDVSEILDTVRTELDEADKTYGVLLADRDAHVRRLEEDLKARKAAPARSGPQKRFEDQLAARATEIAELRRELTGHIRANAAEKRRSARIKREFGASMQALTERDAEAEEREGELADQIAEAGRLAQALRHESKLRAKQEDETAQLSKKLAAREKTTKRLTREVKVREEALAEGRAELEQLRVEVGLVAKSLTTQGQVRAESRAELDRLRRELADRDARLRARSHEARRAERELASLSEQLDRLRDENVRLADERLLADQAWTERTAEMADLRDHVGKLTEGVRRLELERAERDAAVRSGEGLAGELKDQIKRLERGGAAREAALGEQRQRNEGLVSELSQRKEALAAATGEVERLRRDLEAAKAAVEQSDAEHARVEAEAAAMLVDQDARLEALVKSGRLRPSRLRSLSQLASWLIRGRIGLIRGYFRLRRSGDFDAAKYLASYVDVAVSGLSPLMHYAEHGVQEGRERQPRTTGQLPARHRDREREQLATQLLARAETVVQERSRIVAEGKARAKTQRRSSRARSADDRRLAEVIGRDPDAFCDALSTENPRWMTGSLSRSDVRFLFRHALGAKASLAAEIGTGSGFSTALICHALGFASKAGSVEPKFRVVSYDSDAQFLADETRRTGDAARELLPSELLERVTFRAPAKATKILDDHDDSEIGFLFLAAAGPHPLPTLDLLAVLDCLTPQADVVIHNINPPLRGPEFKDWGAKYVFDDLDVVKHVAGHDGNSNIGSITVPDDKEELRAQLLTILYAHPWEVHVGPAEMTEILQVRRNDPARAERSSEEISRAAQAGQARSAPEAKR